MAIRLDQSPINLLFALASSFIGVLLCGIGVRFVMNCGFLSVPNDEQITAIGAPHTYEEEVKMIEPWPQFVDRQVRVCYGLCHIKVQ